MGNGFSPLHKPVAQNDLSGLCVALQQHSTLINAREDDNGLTALMMACAKGYAPLARELIRRGAGLDLQDKVTFMYL